MEGRDKIGAGKREGNPKLKGRPDGTAGNGEKCVSTRVGKIFLEKRKPKGNARISAHPQGGDSQTQKYASSSRRPNR